MLQYRVLIYLFLAMNLYHDIPLGNEDLTEVNAVLEIPMGSRVKYEFDYNTGAIWVDRVGKTPINYTFNYGDLPQTWNEGDNDPLDIIILCKEPLAVGSVVPCRVIGGLKMIDSGEDDYKVLAVADDKYYYDVESPEDVDKNELDDIAYYMLHYKDIHGKRKKYLSTGEFGSEEVSLHGWDSRENAVAKLKECHEAYKVKFGK
ncbi:MAG: inorganic diphosphatase [Candidatus Peribacteria bacterium]|nr:MAG: inorganic diphosphatase [Candidatus Peribacteria bacterium]